MNLSGGAWWVSTEGSKLFWKILGTLLTGETLKLVVKCIGFGATSVSLLALVKEPIDLSIFD